MKISHYAYKDCDAIHNTLFELTALGGTDEEISVRCWRFLAEVHEDDPNAAWPVYAKESLN